MIIEKSVDDHCQGNCVCRIDAILGTPFTGDPFGRAQSEYHDLGSASVIQALRASVGVSCGSVSPSKKGGSVSPKQLSS